MNKLPNISEIKSELELKGKMLIESDEIVFDANYFNSLVLQLPEFHVSEIRPLHKISISKGIDTRTITPYLKELQIQIKEYNSVREKTFSAFLKLLNLKYFEGEFYKLRRILQETNDWPKGKYNEWKYWFHGGDIEFDNIQTGEHFNIRMTNIRCVKYWSIHKYILGTKNESEIGKFIANKKEMVSKMLDLLVLDKKMFEIRTEIGEKQYELINIDGTQNT